MINIKKTHFNDLEEIQDERGMWVIADESGKLFTGIVYESYPDGCISYEGVHVNGKVCGYEKRWHENGQISNSEYKYMNALHGPCKAWNEQGILTFHEECAYGYSLGYKKYDDTGSLIKTYDIKEHPEELAKYKSWIEKIKSTGEDKKWDAIFQWE